MAIRKPFGTPVMADRPLTAADYFAMPVTAERYELLEGELIRMPAPNLEHQDIILELALRFAAHRESHGGRVILSPADIELSEKNVFHADLSYISPERLSIATDHVRGVADFVVEVASPSTRKYDIHDKLPVYALYGVREAWIVDAQRRTTTIHSAEDGRWVRSQTVAFGEPIPSEIIDAGDGGLGVFA
jgi:Uma2 family endonuclease